MSNIKIGNLPDGYNKDDLEQILRDVLGFKFEYVKEGSDEKTVYYDVQMPENATGLDELCLAIEAKLVEFYGVKGDGAAVAVRSMDNIQVNPLEHFDMAISPVDTLRPHVSGGFKHST